MKKQVLTSLVLSGILFTGLNIASAHNMEQNNMPNYNLDPTVVTATRTPVKSFNANANVTVITAKDIERNHFQNITQALETVPGVYIANYGPAGYDQTNTIAINGSKKVVVLIDGVKVDNPQLGFMGIEYKDMSNIAKIEVLKGSASTLYGANAVGGVINIITKRPMKNTNSVSLEKGNFGQSRETLVSMGREGDLTYNIALQKVKSGDYKDGNGNKINSDSSATNMSIALTNKLSEKNEVGARYTSYHGNYKYGAPWEQEKLGDASRNLYAISLKTKIDDYSKNTFIFSQENYRGVYDKNNPMNTWRGQAKNVYISDQYTNELSAKNRLTVGMDYQKTSVKSLNNHILTKAIYVQDEVTPNDKVKVTVGTRLIHNNFYGHKNNSSLNLGYTFDDKNNAYISYSEFFVSPSLDQLVGQWGANPNLKPENGNTKEIGFNHRFDKNTVGSIHAFKRYTKNKISYVGQYENIGQEKAHGWDVQLKKLFNNNLNTSVGYTYLHADATRGQNPNANGYIPKHAVNIAVNYTEKKWDASILGYGAINRPGPLVTSGNKALPNDRYWKWDLNLDYKADANTKLYMNVNNLFNVEYASYSNVVYGGAGQWWSMPGRSIIFGVEHKF